MLNKKRAGEPYVVGLALIFVYELPELLRRQQRFAVGSFDAEVCAQNDRDHEAFEPNVIQAVEQVNVPTLPCVRWTSTPVPYASSAADSASQASHQNSSRSSDWLIVTFLFERSILTFRPPIFVRFKNARGTMCDPRLKRSTWQPHFGHISTGIARAEARACQRWRQAPAEAAMRSAIGSMRSSLAARRQPTRRSQLIGADSASVPRGPREQKKSVPCSP